MQIYIFHEAAVFPVLLHYYSHYLCQTKDLLIDCPVGLRLHSGVQWIFSSTEVMKLNQSCSTITDSRVIMVQLLVFILCDYTEL